MLKDRAAAGRRNASHAITTPKAKETMAARTQSGPNAIDQMEFFRCKLRHAQVAQSRIYRDAKGRSDVAQ